MRSDAETEVVPDHTGGGESQSEAGRHPPAQPRDRRSFVAACALHAALALVILGVTVTRPLGGIPQPANLRLWFPLGFAASSLVVYAMAWPLPPADRRTALALDLVAWLTLPACIVASRLNPAWTPAWLTGAIGTKTLVCVVAVFMAARVRASARLAGLALSTQYLNLSLVALPYTRYPGMPNSLGLTGDEPHYLAATAALLYYRTLYVERVYASHIFIKINGAFIPYRGGWQFQTRYVGNGHYAPAHDLGLSFLAIPFFAVGGNLAVQIAMAVLAAATVYLAYRLVVSIGIRSEIAVLSVAASCFLLPFLPYATQVFPEVPIAFAAVATACYLLRSTRSWAAYSGVSVLLAVLPWIHTRAWGLLLPLLIGVVLSERSWLRRAVAPMAVAVSEVGYIVLLRLVYGHFLLTPTPPAPLDWTTLTATRLLIALESPFLDPDNGLFLLAPVFLIAIAAWPLLVRHVRVGWAIVVAVALYSLELGVTHLVGAAAGYSPPGRLMVSCVPLLAPALALGVARLRIRGWSAIFWLCVGYGAVLAFAVNANRVATYRPGMLRVLASILEIRGPTVTVTGHGPWYAALLVLAVLIVLVLLIGLNGSGRSELRARSELSAGTSSERG